MVIPDISEQLGEGNVRESRRVQGRPNPTASLSRYQPISWPMRRPLRERVVGDDVGNGQVFASLRTKIHFACYLSGIEMSKGQVSPMNDSSLRVLLIAGESANFSAARAIPLLDIVACGDVDDAVERATREKFDAILLDGALGVLRAATVLAARVPQLPVISICMEDQEREALTALDLGLDDYLMASELTPIALCRALRNARRFRQRVEPAPNLGVPQHLCERLASSLGVIEAFADTMQRQLVGPPAASMAGVLMEEIHQLQQLTSDLTDNRRLRTGSLPLNRQWHRLGDLAQAVLQIQHGVEWTRRTSAAWQALTVCDQGKTVRSIAQLIDVVRCFSPQAELRLVADESQPRLGIQRIGQPFAPSSDLLVATEVSAGEAGFERSVALRLLDAQQITVQVERDTLWLDLPGSFESLTSRWIDWTTRHTEATVSICDVSASASRDEEDPLTAADSLDWVSVFLQQSVGNSALVLERAEDRWVIALPGERQAIQRHLKHLAATSQIVDPQVTLRFELTADYQLPLQREALGRSLTTRLSQRCVLVLEHQPAPISPVSQRLTEAGYRVAPMTPECTGEDKARATAIVGDAAALNAWDGPLPNLPTFLIGTLKDQQSAMRGGVRFIRGDNDEENFVGLLAALEQTQQ